MENSISSDLIRGHIDTIILYALVDGDKHTQQISDAILLKSENKYEINQATLYSSLKRLEKLSYVRPYWYDSEGGRRRFFKLTDKGQKFIDENLSSWSFSRSIIDKLLNTENEKQSDKVVYVEKIVEKPVYIEQKAEETNSVEEPKNMDGFTVDNTSPLNAESEQKNITIENIDNTVETFDYANEKELNFRNVLNGLIKTVKIVEESDLQDTVVIEKDVKKEKLFDAIEQKNDNKVINKCNIDFGDLEIDASKKGYKIRFSNTGRKINLGKMLVNKLNFVTSIFLTVILFGELFGLYYSLNSYINIDTSTRVLSIIAVVIPFLLFSIIYICSPRKISKNPKTNSIFSFLVVLFDLILFSFVVEWLSGIDFSQTYEFIVYYLIPVAICFDIYLFILIRYFLSKSKSFVAKKH